MEGLDLGQTSNPSLAWKVFKINDDDDEVFFSGSKSIFLEKLSSLSLKSQKTSMVISNGSKVTCF